MRIVKKMAFLCLWLPGRICAYLYPFRLNEVLSMVKNIFYSGWVSAEFKSVGERLLIIPPISLVGGKYISIGNRFCLGKNGTLTAWDRHVDDVFRPKIIIGNNVSIGTESHITAINSIKIGNNVLTGKKVTITDNAHGKADSEAFSLPPAVRHLYSPGPVIIEDGVWLGDKVSILPNVVIGRNSIIGANSVVTKNIPPNCVACGNPAKVVKTVAFSWRDSA